MRPMEVEVSNGSVADANVTPACVQFGEQVQEVGQAAGEPVHAVDQQHVEPARSCAAQRLLASRGDLWWRLRRRRCTWRTSVQPGWVVT